MNLILPNNIKVVRNGHIIEILSSNLVLGDCLVLDLGNQIVADARVKYGVLEVNESFLTGESKSVLKKQVIFYILVVILFQVQLMRKLLL
uniref:P-type ATPase A domain-containing protein n=1 Tax=Candidatus Phytoplasma australasiaticum subsp. australasiaticum TaxID=2832407 RepID=A0A7S7G0Z5_9MOLU|nr:hypothetical protein H7685_01275 ['Parthenium hysterophorus' phyllody phytoplasma]